MIVRRKNKNDKERKIKITILRIIAYAKKGEKGEGAFYYAKRRKEGEGEKRNELVPEIQRKTNEKKNQG